MFGRKKQQEEMLGIHVGRDTLTIARVLRTPATLEVTQVFHEPLARDPGAWPRELAGSAFRRARRAVSLKADHVVVTVASDLAPSAFLILPAVKGEQLHNAVKLQLENKRGAAGGELCFQYQILEKRGERCRLFAPSIPRETLRAILSSLLDVHCTVDSMEVEGVSLANLLVYCGMGQKDPVAALDVSAGGSEIHIVRRSRIALSRPIPKLETDGRPEEPPRPTGENATAAQESATIHSTWFGRIVREANKTLDYFEIELLSPPVQRMVVFGPELENSDLSRLLGDVLEIPVDALDTGDSVRDRTGRYDPVQHAVAVGATLGEGMADED